MKSAFNQIMLEETSRPYTAFRSSLGCFQFKRLPFWLPNAPSSMTSLIGQVVTGLDGVLAYLDDILVGAPDLETCKENLEKVFMRLKEFNLTISPEKCSFFKDSVIYLDHVLSAEGIKADPAKQVL